MCWSPRLPSLSKMSVISVAYPCVRNTPSEVMWSVVMWSELTWHMWSDFVLKFSEVQWRDVKCSDVEWTDVIYTKWFCFEVQWCEVKCSEVSYVEVLGTKVPCTLEWLYTVDIWLYCDYFIWCVPCTVVVLTFFVMCGWVYGGGVLVICVLVFTVFCIVCTVFCIVQLCIFI